MNSFIHEQVIDRTKQIHSPAKTHLRIRYISKHAVFIYDLRGYAQFTPPAMTRQDGPVCVVSGVPV